jgi:hypothetical protein
MGGTVITGSKKDKEKTEQQKQNQQKNDIMIVQYDYG